MTNGRYYRPDLAQLIFKESLSPRDEMAYPLLSDAIDKGAAAHFTHRMLSEGVAKSRIERLSPSQMVLLSTPALDSWSHKFSRQSFIDEITPAWRVDHFSFKKEKACLDERWIPPPYLRLGRTRLSYFIEKRNEELDYAIYVARPASFHSYPISKPMPLVHCAPLIPMTVHEALAWPIWNPLPRLKWPHQLFKDIK